MKNKKFLIALFAALLVFVFSACNPAAEEEEEINPQEFSYDMLDLSFVADEIYKSLEISELTLKSISKITDKTVLSEQFYLDLDNVISYDIRSALGNYGVADFAIIRVKEGKASEVIESRENRKTDCSGGNKKKSAFFAAEAFPKTDDFVHGYPFGQGR